MPDISEVLKTQTTMMAADNQAGVDAISYFQEITFTLYRRVVLPADGFVFWVRDRLLSREWAQPNILGPNVASPNQPGVIGEAAKTLTVKGSLHYASDSQQLEDGTPTINRVVFTAEEEVQDLNIIAPDTMWLGQIDDIKFAFNTRSSFYRQAGLWHYVGDAVYPEMYTQIIDDPAQFDGRLIVSNSLPIWLSMNKWMPVDYLPFSNPSLPLYPSFAVPDNTRPPYATIHVQPDETAALAAAPGLGKTYSHYQLSVDRVRVTIWGQNNDAAMNFVDFVNQFSYYEDTIGIMNMPILRDEKRTQSELTTLAQKKVIDYQVSYLQTSVRDVARQLIKRAIPTYIINNHN